MSSDLRPRIWLVDAFTHRRGGGNPAAFVPLPGPVSLSWLQMTAADLDLPVTTYLLPDDEGKPQLRWFTRSGELPSCGHGSLAAAKILFDELGHADPIAFSTPLGPLIARRDRDGISLTVPAQPTQEWSLPAWAAQALGVAAVEVRRSARHALVRVASETDVRQIDPDLRALADLPTVGLAVTAPGSAPYDITSRWFVPRERLEDQATGTAHALLGPYWADRTGRSRLVAYQASRRGGDLELTVEGTRVALWGRAVVTVRGQLCEPPPSASIDQGGGES